MHQRIYPSPTGGQPRWCQDSSRTTSAAAPVMSWSLVSGLFGGSGRRIRKLPHRQLSNDLNKLAEEKRRPHGQGIAFQWAQNLISPQGYSPNGTALFNRINNRALCFCVRRLSMRDRPAPVYGASCDQTDAAALAFQRIHETHACAVAPQASHNPQIDVQPIVQERRCLGTVPGSISSYSPEPR